MTYSQDDLLRVINNEQEKMKADLNEMSIHDMREHLRDALETVFYLEQAIEETQLLLEKYPWFVIPSNVSKLKKTKEEIQQANLILGKAIKDRACIKVEER